VSVVEKNAFSRDAIKGWRHYHIIDSARILFAINRRVATPIISKEKQNIWAVIRLGKADEEQ
jgi:hypothetical protein